MMQACRVKVRVGRGIRQPRGHYYVRFQQGWRYELIRFLSRGIRTEKNDAATWLLVDRVDGRNGDWPVSRDRDWCLVCE